MVIYEFLSSVGCNLLFVGCILVTEYWIPFFTYGMYSSKVLDAICCVLFKC